MITTLLIWFAAAALGLVLLGLADMTFGNATIAALRDQSPPPRDAELPRVAVVVAARDEEPNVEPAVRSLLRLDYPDYEIVAVDDRSTDATGAILDRLAAEDARLRVVHVSELPTGWLGKNHALWLGARESTGAWLLFTDADVLLEPTALVRAIEYARARRLDHLTAAPQLVLPSLAVQAFVGTFLTLFSLFARPWRCRDPRSRAHLGIGAFNLLRRDAYLACGGHEPIRLRPDDDLKLGKLVKRAGLRQDVVWGRGLIEVEWYSTLGGVVDGLLKNTFAGVDYSLWRAAGATAALLAVEVWPFVALAVVDGWAWILNAAIALALLCVYVESARRQNIPVWLAPTLPLGVLLFLYILWKSAFRALSERGVRWRGTLYPLEELRANRVDWREPAG